MFARSSTTVIRDNRKHAIQEHQEPLQRIVFRDLVLLGRVHKPRDRNEENETRPDDNGRNNRNQEARVEVVLVVDALQMEHLDHLKNGRTETSTCVVFTMEQTDVH